MVVGLVTVMLARRMAIPTVAMRAMVVTFVVCILALTSELMPGGGIIRLVHTAFEMDFPRFIDKNINRGLCALVILGWVAASALNAHGYRRAAFCIPMLLLIPVFGFDSVSAQLAMVVGFVIFGLVWLAPRIGPVLVAIAIVGFVAFWPVAFPFLDIELLSRPAIYMNLPDTAQHRVEIWRFVLDRIAEKPWLGWGMDTSRAMPGGQVIYSGERKYLPLHPHNSALQILLEIGVIGFAIAILGLAAALRSWVRATVTLPRAISACGAALICGYLCIGFTAFGVWQYWWIALGFLAAGLWCMAANSCTAKR